MVLFKEAGLLADYCRQEKEKGKKIGFVPTMGALHPGHVSLIHLSRKSNDITVCSIFINPTQFNNAEDLLHYPVTIEKDIEALEASGCEVLFLPSVQEIYPAGYQKKHYDLGPIEFVLEGKYRPGHFQGVCQVVERLLEIVEPHQIFLGQKDMQQCLVVRKLLQLMNKDQEIELHIAPTLREPDGLAMSSRNLRLDNKQRKTALTLFQVLSMIRDNMNSSSPAELKSRAIQRLEQEGFRVDYVELADASDLMPAPSGKKPDVALVAATIGDVRLIDNLPLN